MKKQIAFIPITKVDAERREVWGVLAEEAPDKSGEIMDYAKSKPHFLAWSYQFEKATDGKSKGNLRAMHTKIAAGKIISLTADDLAKRIEIGAKVVDDAEWAKCLEGVYTGFSVGGDYGDRWIDAAKLKRYEAIPVEASLVDNPCMYGATFELVRGVEVRKFVGEEAKMVKHEGDDWVLYSSDGSKVLGRHKSKADAMAQEQAIEAKKAALAEALAKWDAAAEALQKDAVAAIGEANSALASLKRMTAELVLLPGEPDTWALADILDAIRSIIGAKVAAENKASSGTAPEVPGAGPAEPAMEMAMKPEELQKMVKDTVTEAVTEQGKASEEGLQKAVGAAVEKAVGDAVGKAVEGATKPVLDKVAGIEERLGKLEALPAPVGTPVQKTIGADGTAGDPNEPTRIINDALANLAKEGVPPEVLRKARLEFTEQLIKATH